MNPTVLVASWVQPLKLRDSLYPFRSPTLPALPGLRILRIRISTSRLVPRHANVTGISRGQPGSEVTSNGPIHGRAGVADDAWAGLFVLHQPARDQAEDGDLGIVLQIALRVSGVLLDVWTDAFFSRWATP